MQAFTILSESELVAAIVKHDSAGAEGFYDNCQSTLFKIIYCRLKNMAGAELILGKTMLYIWDNLSAFQSQDKRLFFWMAGIARGLALEAMKPGLQAGAERLPKGSDTVGPDVKRNTLLGHQLSRNILNQLEH